ncbi:MAG: transcription repressor NadR [Lachnospiraceae bacterium]|jgi:transcriptional regulator of NAD metabolism|nr:transcription repressor NadR [Lachnospiraceae bacterium]MCX4315050.1 transcription repressor NadR [Lachnospiraceae bacterium]
MEGVERRQELLRILQESPTPVSGSKLAGRLGVSRQVIVQDVALLRAVNRNILPTTRGYMLYEQARGKVNRVYLVRHTTEQIEDELSTIVELGGKVLNIIVSHELYGQIEADLIIENRRDVEEFIQKLKTKKPVPLKELTDGLHFHTVEADSEEILDRIGEALEKKGYLQEVT